MRTFRFPTALLTGLLLSGTCSQIQAQTINYFTPELGQVGQRVDIYGSGFYLGPGDQVNQVWFGDIQLPPYIPGTTVGFYVVSATKIEAFVPVGAVDAPISVKRPNGQRVYSSTSFNVIGSEPYVTSFHPYTGTAGTEITIEGVQFQSNVSSVKINGTNVASYFIQTANTIKAVAQSDVTTGPITVVGIGTGSNTTAELFYVPPVVYGFSPTNGRAGEQLTINGLNLTNTTEVKIGNVPLPVFSVNGNTQIVATVASGAVSGKVIVQTPGGQYQTTTNFTLLPSITSFSPTFGTTNTQVTISGANLNVPPLGVLFNGVAASIVSSNFNQIVAVAPASSSGPITVTTADGSTTSASVFYYPPKITSFAPGAGGAGTVVSINGTSFTNATSVLFDGTPALYYTVSNNVLIGAAAPNAVSTGLLTVNAPGGVALSSVPFYGPATVTGFLPAEGLPGTAITVFGANFEGATAVAFNGTPAPINSNTGTQIGTAVPTNATSGPISVTTPAGIFLSSSAFTVSQICDLRINTFLNTPNPLPVTSSLTLTIVPANNGPNDASNVTATVTLPAGVELASASTTRGTVNTNGNPVVFSIGTMSIFANPTLTLVLVPQNSGTITNTVALASSTFDTNTGNNTQSRTTTVLPVPELNIGLNQPNQVRIAWPVQLTNYLLQSNLVLTNSNSWSNVSSTPVIQGGERVVTQPATGSARFYRLKQ